VACHRVRVSSLGRYLANRMEQTKLKFTLEHTIKAQMGRCIALLYLYSRPRPSLLNPNGFGDLVVSMLASGTQDRGFDPGQSRRFFRAKNPQHAFLRRGSKAFCPMSQICGM
jgi:hypothetical protein